VDNERRQVEVDLARFSIEYWDLDSLTQKMRELKAKYQIR